MVKLCLFFFVFLFSLPLFAQASDDYSTVSVGDTVRIETDDGNIFIGKIVEKDSSNLRLITFSQIDIKVPAAIIVSVENVSRQIVENVYMYADPNNTRLFFSPTARTLSKGNGYFSIYQIFFPSAGYGFTNYISLSGGISLVPGTVFQLVYFNPKVRLFQTDLWAAALGLHTFFVASGSEGEAFASGVVTYGNEKSALTAGIFAPLTSETVGVMFGGEVRVGKRIKLLSENWYIFDDTVMLSAGVRFFGQKLAADLGFFYFTQAGISGFPFLPWIGFAYNF
ncbi:MAG TPA: hypothetical protein EYP36_12930 [Calditrichaeota bacterium]|nr:hypothetical protein [Calditrichota bacterium]